MDLAASVTCASREATRALGNHIGRHCRQGIVIALQGDLGSGKTTFVQGLASGLHVPDNTPVTSPSYTIVNEYAGRLPLIHADLYRLPDAASLEDIGIDDWLDTDAVIAVEWSEKLPEWMRDDHLEITIRRKPDGARRFDFCAYGQHSGDLVDIVNIFHKESLWG